MDDLDFSVSPTVVTLKDSCQVSKKRFDKELNRIWLLYPNHPVFMCRRRGSLKREWAAHNALYACGIAEERTKSCDLEWPQKWYMKIAWGVLGFFAMLWIK